jgi:hypothetical protein
MSLDITEKLNNAPAIQPDQHVFIPGMTGSGKSVLAETYLAGYDNVIKLDSKDEVTERRKKGQPLWRGLTEDRDYTVVTALAEIPEVDTNKIIYVPRFEEQNLEHYDAFFKYVYERENTIAWVDELMAIADSARVYPPYLKACYTRGRSKNVSIWALTQRPVEVPTIATANSTHFFVYDLMLDQDRQKMAAVTGMKEMQVNPGWHNFWYYKNGMQHAVKARLTFKGGY